MRMGGQAASQCHGPPEPNTADSSSTKFCDEVLVGKVFRIPVPGRAAPSPPTTSMLVTQAPVRLFDGKFQQRGVSTVSSLALGATTALCFFCIIVAGYACYGRQQRKAPDFSLASAD